MPIYLIASAILMMGNAVARTPVLQTQNGAVVHWGKPFLEIGLDPQMTSRNLSRLGIQKAVAHAIATWNHLQAGQPQLYLVDQGPFDMTVRFCRTQWKGSKVDLGHSEFTADPKTGLVESAIIEINECDQSFFVPGEPTKGRHALAAVLVHEFGHTLGLGHSKNPSSVMFPTGGGVTLHELQPEDMSAIGAIYLGRFSNHPPLTRNSPAGTLNLALAPVPASMETMIQRTVPENATPLLSIKTHNGRELMVYTSEPTLLPPLKTSLTDRPRKPRQGKEKR